MCITSTFPRELIVTLPFALGMQPAVTAPAERTKLKVVFCANALMLIELSTRPITNERLFFTVMFFLFYSLVRVAVLCHSVHGLLLEAGGRPSPRPAGSATFLSRQPPKEGRSQPPCMDRALALRIAHRSTPGACDEL